MQIFSKEDKKHFTYPAIIEHRENRESIKWIIGAILLIVIASVVYFLLK